MTIDKIMKWDIQTFGEVRVGAVASWNAPRYAFERRTQEHTIYSLAERTDWIVLHGEAKDQILHSECLKVWSAGFWFDPSVPNSSDTDPAGPQGRGLHVQDDKCPKCRQEVPAFVYFLL